jgi:hypothetical protein
VTTHSHSHPPSGARTSALFPIPDARSRATSHAQTPRLIGVYDSGGPFKHLGDSALSSLKDVALSEALSVTLHGMDMPKTKPQADHPQQQARCDWGMSTTQSQTPASPTQEPARAGRRCCRRRSRSRSRTPSLRCWSCSLKPAQRFATWRRRQCTPSSVALKRTRSGSASRRWAPSSSARLPTHHRCW